MWIRVVESGQELDIANSLAWQYIEAGHAVEIPPPKPRKEEPKKEEAPKQPAFHAEQPVAEQAAVLVYKVGLPRAAAPLVERLLRTEKRVEELERKVAELEARPRQPLVDLVARR